MPQLNKYDRVYMTHKLPKYDYLAIHRKVADLCPKPMLLKGGRLQTICYVSLTG